MTKTKLMVLKITVAAFLLSCNKNSIEYVEPIQVQKLTQEQEALKSRIEQRALITATVMRDKGMVNLYVNAVKDKIKANKINDEAITFDEILNEEPFYISNFAKEFKKKYAEVYYSHHYFRAYKFPVPQQQTFNSVTGSTQIRSAYDELFINNDGAQIYFPYSENFTVQQVASPAVTYYPLADLENVEAYKGLDKPDSLITFIANEPYAIKSPTFVRNIDLIRRPAIIDSFPPPPPPVYSCNFLSYNTYSDVLGDQYVISTTIPKIRLLKNFRTWIGGTNVLTILQCYAKPNNISIDPQPVLAPIDGDKRFVCKDLKIKRKHVGEWLDFANVYNDDWRLLQYDNPMIIFSKQGWFYNTNGNIKC